MLILLIDMGMVWTRFCYCLLLQCLWRQIGQGQYATLIAIWKQCIRRGQKLTIVEPGTQMRSFTYIDDIVEGIIAAGAKGKGDGYSLGAEEVYSLWEVGEMFGKKSREEYNLLPARPGDRKGTYIDLTKTTQDLGWSTKTKLKDHLAQFMKSQNEVKK